MSEKADRLALGCSLTLLLVLCSAIALRLSWEPIKAFFETAFVVPAPVEPSPVPPVATPYPIINRRPILAGDEPVVGRSLEPVPVQPVEPEIRRAIPVEKPSTPVPPAQSRLVVPISPKGWSRLVEVPPGRGGSITFSLGRIRVERNGVDLGIIYRKSSLQGRVVNGQLDITNVDLGAFFDKRPRTLTIDPGTRTLRFRSEEREGGEVVVTFE